MKKTLFLLSFILGCISLNYGQCINDNTNMTDPIPAVNYGNIQEISQCVNTNTYVTISNIIIGGDYIFTCVANDEIAVDKYITVTDLNNTPIAFGVSPLSVEGIGFANIRIHYSEDSSCTMAENCNIATLQAILSCPVPTEIQLSGVTTTGASFSWVAGGTEEAWRVLVLPQESNAPEEGNPVLGTAINGDPNYSINTLTAGQHYKFYVRSDCGGSDYSPWRGPYDFASACEPGTVLNEDLESTPDGGLPECWTRLFVGASQYASLSTVGFFGHSGTKCIQISNDSSPTTSNLILVSPPLTTVNTQTHRLKFFARGYGNVTLEVGTIDATTADGTFHLLKTISVTNTYTEFVVDFTEYTGTDTFFAFRHPSLTQSNPIFLDDIRWEVAPLCKDVTAINVDAITTTTASISWTPGGSETRWDIVYAPSSTANPDALTPISPAPENTAEGSISGLSPNTEYKVWVRSSCDGSIGNGAWMGPVTFTTSCLPTNGLNENFNTTDLGDLPGCWSSIVKGTTISNTAYIKVLANYGTLGSNAVGIFNSDSSSDATFILVSPNLNTLTSDHRLKFYAYSAQGSGATIEVGTLNTAGSGATFTTYQSLQLTNGYVEYTVDFTNYTGTNTYVGIKLVGSEFVGALIDNVRWELTPLCPDVTAVAASNVADTTATISWDSNGSETQWDVVYGSEAVTDPSTLTPINPAPTTNPTATLSGLTASTTYNVWVRSACGGTEGNGAWIGPLVFTTACVPVGDLNEGFEGLAWGELPTCWSRLIYGPTVGQYAAVRVVEDSASASGLNSVELWTGDSAETDFIALVSPYLNTINATHILKFSAFSYPQTHLEIGTMDGNANDSTFSPIQQVAIGEEHVEYTIDFSNYTGTDTYLAFKNISGSSKSIYIDDIRWEPVLSTPDFSTSTFSYYPNPVKDILKLSYSDNITNVKVFNLLGQKVVEMDMNQNNALVDMSGLPTGNYIVKVIGNTMSKTIKVIKE